MENNARAAEIEEENGKNVENVRTKYRDLSYSTIILLVATPYLQMLKRKFCPHEPGLKPPLLEASSCFKTEN